MHECDACGDWPASGWLRDTDRYLCGVCAHRLMVAKDLAQRIRLWKLQQQNIEWEQAELNRRQKVRMLHADYAR